MINRLKKDFGFNIIPVKPGTKKPALVSWKEYQEKKYPWDLPENSSYAVVLGKISGYVVVDSDTKEAEEYIAKNFPVTTLMAKTKKGYHRYYKYPENTEIKTSSKIVPMGGADLKAEKSYCLIPPTENYEWISICLSDVPVFDVKWTHYKGKSASNKKVDTTSSEILKGTPMSFLFKTENTISDIYVKDTVLYLKGQGVAIDYSNTGPMKSNEPHINGYVLSNIQGLKFYSYAEGIFANIIYNLEEQWEYLQWKRHG